MNIKYLWLLFFISSLCFNCYTVRTVLLLESWKIIFVTLMIVVIKTQLIKKVIATWTSTQYKELAKVILSFSVFLFVFHSFFIYVPQVSLVLSNASSLFGTRLQLTHPLLKSSTLPLRKMSVFQGVASEHINFTLSCIIFLWNSATVHSPSGKDFHPSSQNNARFPGHCISANQFHFILPHSSLGLSNSSINFQ